MFKNYIKIAWRHILKNKGFSAINIGGLAIGLASCLLLLLYINYEWGYDKQFENIENIYTIENNQTGDGQVFTFMATPGVMAETIENEVPGVVRSIHATYPYTELLGYGDKSMKKKAIFTDPEFFSMFSYKFISGNPETALEDVNNVVLTRDLAVSLFGTEAEAMGKILRFKDKNNLKVTGIVENPPVNSSLQYDYVVPWKVYENENPWTKTAGWNSNFCMTFVELSSQQQFEQADAQVRTLINSNQDGYKGEAFLFPFSKQQLYSKFENGVSVGGAIDQVKLFLWLAIGILLIACVNFMNLSTARSQKKALEVGVRKTLGSSRNALLWQFMSESIMISALAMILALLIVIVSMPYFNQLLELQLNVPYLSWEFWLFIIFLILFTGFTAGSYPAFYLSSFNPLSVLKGKLSEKKALFSLRRVMVVLQFGFSISLIVATICIYQQIKFIQNKPIGYDQSNLVQIPVEGDLRDHLDLFKNEVEKEGAVVSSCVFSQDITRGGNNGWGVEWPGKDPNARILFDFFNVGDNFSETTGVKILEGREFSEKFPADTLGSNVMVNKTAAELMNVHVGDQISSGDEPATIVGIFDDFVKNSPYSKVAPMLISYAGDEGNFVALKLNPAQNISSSVDKISSVLQELNPAYPPDIQFADESFERKFKNEKVLGSLSIIFGGLCIFISCLGLFGLSAFSAQLRIKEIGVRKVLGASVPQVVAMLSKEFVALVAISFLIAFPLSWFIMQNWLQNYEYHIELSWWIYALAAVTALIIALFTVSFQAIKAAVSNPVKSLRNE